MAKAGLFAFVILPTKKKAAPRKLGTEIKANLFYEKGDLNVIEAKQQYKVEHNEPLPVDGQPLPDHSEGWMLTRVSDPELHCVAVRCIRLTDGTNVKYFKMLVLPSVMKTKRAKLRRKMRELDKSIAKAAKQEARLTLFLMSK